MSSTNRRSMEETFLNIAFEWSERSTCSTRIAVGAVLVNGFKQIVASGYNGAPRGLPHCDEVGCELDSDGHCVRALHAEENVIIQCAMSGVHTFGNILYVTHSPCQRCARVIIQAGIKDVVYAWEYKNVGPVKAMFTVAGISLRKFNLP